MAKDRLSTHLVPAFNDNYIWLIQLNNKPAVYAIDPGDANVVIDYLNQHQLTLAGILITHHHHDHTGGVAELYHHYVKGNSKFTIYGPHTLSLSVPIEDISKQSSFQVSFEISNDASVSSSNAHRNNHSSQDDTLTIEKLELPGHTLDHLAYSIDDKLFCGDTLFSAGCGRLFEGTAKQMFQSLKQIKTLPKDTKIYSAHEYTLANLAFAQHVDPNNEELNLFHRNSQIKRKDSIATLPSTLADELKINPFLRCDSTAIIESVKREFDQQSLTELECFTLLRQWKDNF